MPGSEEQKSIFNKEKWLPLCRDAPFKISHYCCKVMKKSPIGIYERHSGLKPIIGTMTEESMVRKQAWLRHGCNAFDSSHQSSQPMSFWTEQDVLAYIADYGIEIAPVYGQVVRVDPKGNKIDPLQDIGYFTEDGDFINGFEGCAWKCTGCQRTGCVFCAFGAHHDKGETRFQRLKRTHPKQYAYCMNGGQWIDNPDYDPDDTGEPDEIGWVNWNPKQIWIPSKEGLGMRYVFDWCNDLYGKDFIRYE